MTNNQLIEQDWEREFQKDFVYLHEREREIEEEYYESLRKPATINVAHETEKIEKNAEQIKEL